MLTLPGYQVGDLLSESTTVRVYHACRNSDNLSVIVKLLKKAEPAQEELARLRREFEIIRQIAAPGIVVALELLSKPGCHALVMEDFGGLPLTQAVPTGSLPLVDFLKLALEMTRALQRIHQQHIIHKDIKPDNILLNPATGVLKIIDFSIATGLASERQTLRPPNILEGTLAYISPEQTGRVNRVVDVRSDLYALGVTFYQLLAGRLPFDSQEPVALVHSHIAMPPPPVSRFAPGIPPVIERLVARLMAKNAEERYQSCAGLLSDLEQCLEQLQPRGEILPFEPGRLDRMEQFSLPQKLYGRARETAALLAAFERAADPAGGAEMVLIAGHLGIGKTSLVQELYRPITLRGGYFVSGKFDPMQRNLPYFALLQALRSLIQQILSEPEAMVSAWRALLLEALGANAQIMLDVIPELERITGPVPAVMELPPGQAQNRYRLVFQNFARVFTRREHPLVLFLDDLQWSDSASLELLEFLAVAPGQQYLLIIGAYRDNEVADGHPLLRSVERIRKAGRNVTELKLISLLLDDVTHFIEDAFHAPPAAARPLAALVYPKTAGNPFFINEFVKALVAQQVIHFEPASGWDWDMEQIRSRPITDNVVDLVASNIRQLSPAAQRVLQWAAYLGGQFDLQTLALAYQATPSQTAVDLWEAIEAQLVLPLNDAYNLAAYSEIPAGAGLNAEYRFAHDRIRQAVEELIPAAQRLELHQHLGKLLDALPPTRRAEKIFDIANHLNLARAGLGSAADKSHLAEINLQAGRRAQKSAAFQPAWDYFCSGLALLESDSWQVSYALTLDLYQEAIGAGFSCGLLDACLPLIEVVLQNAHGLHDQSIAHQIMIKIQMAQNQPVAALEHALEVLKQLGVNLPLRPTEEDLQRERQKVQTLLTGRPIEALLDIPEMTDPDRLAAMQILTSTTVAAFNAIRPLYALISFERVSLSITYGNAPMSPAAYAAYGLTLCSNPAQIEQGYQFGRLALRLQEKLQALPYKARTLNTAYAFIMHWKEPVRSIIGPLLDAYQSSLETGDIEFASSALVTHAYIAFLSGLELPLLRETFHANVLNARRLRHPRNARVMEMHLQLVVNLLKPGPTSEVISGEIYQEESALPLHIQSSDFITVFRLYAYKVLISCTFGRFAQAAEYLKTLEKYLSTVGSEVFAPLYYFYGSLIPLALYPTLPEAEQVAALERVALNQARLELLAQHAPANQRHRFCLVEAERARLAGRGGEAREWYDQAIQMARENLFLQEEGLACERAADFYLGRGQAHLGAFYLNDARKAYAQWGAQGKVQHLEETYSAYFSQPGAGQFHSLSEQITTSSHSPGSSLDIASLVKYSQAISSEIVLEKLLAALMKIIIENAGAQGGFLLLEDGGEWVIAAGHDSAAGTRQPIEAEPPRMAVSVVRYVIHTHETVALDDAIAAGSFRNDAYIISRQVHSLLCLPLIKLSSLVGVLYLENNLAAGVFTPQRLEFLRLLSTQAAISIENAHFYDTLEQKVAERTLELRLAEERARSLAITDPLTEIFNRRHFFAMLEGEISRVHRYQGGFGLLMLDIDHFKNVNDEYGHQVGDQVLRAVAALGKASLRDIDTVARYGGEEFVALLPETSLENTLLAAERLRQKLETTPILTAAGPVSITASLGVTIYHETLDKTAESVLERADLALYQAKELGRNRVFAAP